MKRIIIIIVVLLFICGCSNNKSLKKEDNKKEEVNNDITEVQDTYKDDNSTPISIYKGNGNKLIKIHDFNSSLSSLEDIGVFLIYPSNEEEITLNTRFGEAFYNEWIKYNTNNQLKIGFNIKFSLNDGRKVSFNVLDPSMAIGEYYDFMLTYLYDDYKNRFSSWYSHIEPDEYNNETLFTSIKLQSGYEVAAINSNIELYVFTYDTEDDFLESGEYRGNSLYKINIVKK